MKELKKIRLINWHMFHNRTIEVKGNILLTGENGTGKSTLLDAIQYVLNAGKAKFNIAANEGAKRKVEGYIRGKLGVEGKEYLRNGDVTTHVALEFFDDVEKKPFVIGCVLDLNKSETTKKHFYALYNTSIKDEFYINENNQPKSWRFFKSTLDKEKIKYDAEDQQMAASSMIRQTLGLSKKYNELLPKALAFKPIDSLNKFMFDYLLNKNEINLESLTDNIRRYREFEKILKTQKKSLEILERIHTKNELIQEKQLKLAKQTYLNDLIIYYQSENQLQDKKTRLDYLNNHLKNLERDKINTKNEYDRIESEYMQLNHALENNDGYRLKKQLTEKYQQVQAQHVFAKSEFDHFYKDLTQEIKFLSQLRYQHELPTTKEDVLNDSKLSLQLKEIETYLKNKRNTISRNLFKLENDIETYNSEYKSIEKNLDSLRKKSFSYRKEINNLITLLKEELQKYYGTLVEVRPFCEYLEINDETWRHAIEGYLNTQRFDIILEPKYFNKASELYEEYKEKLGIYGIGIVDVSKLENYDSQQENTLAQKVDTNNPYARWYANYLLNPVKLEKNVALLRNHTIAITPTCMVYKNYTIRAINPSIYSKPFIGQSAIEMQRQAYEEKLEEVKTELIRLNKTKKDYERQEKIIEQSKISTLTETSYNKIYTYKSIQEQLIQLEKDLKEIKKDDSWITLEIQKNEKAIQKEKIFNQSQQANTLFESAKLEEQQLEKEVEQLTQQMNMIQEIKIEQEKENIAILQDTENMYMALKKKYNRDFERMKRQNSESILTTKNEIQQEEFNLKQIMHEYNQFTNIGYAENKEELPKYLEKYEKLRNIELDETIRKSENARRKCQDSFQEDFISKLKSLFDSTKKEIKKLNDTLKNREFDGEVYEFIVKPSENKAFAQYYDIINSGEDFSKTSLFVEELSEKNRHIMEELFDKLALVNNDGKNEKTIQEYTDYRKYMSYDIRIHNADGTTTLFSKVSTEKSGGETQTPYYVTIAASFEQLLNVNKRQNSCGCLVLFDEAFNNMDESRIENMMRFYKDLNIQLMIAVPPGRVQTIAPHVDTVLTLIKQNNQIYIGEFNHEL